jgi:hypothetical protein
MSELQLIVLLSLAVYRVTRFIIRDTLIDAPRNWLYGKLVTPGHPFLDKVYELLDCPYCLGIWISAFSVAIARHYTPVSLPVFVWLAVAGGAMIVWRIVERDEEHK